MSLHEKEFIRRESRFDDSPILVLSRDWWRNWKGGEKKTQKRKLQKTKEGGILNIWKYNIWNEYKEEASAVT